MSSQTDSVPCEQTSVVICGGGPTGVLLSALLGQFGVPNIVLEREAQITTDPRGIALDEDGVRILQSIGVYDRIYTEIGTCMQKFNFVSGTGKDLYKRPLLSVDYNTSEGGTGHVGFICHKQPALEKAIRDQVASNSLSELRSQSTLVAIEEDQDHAYVDYTDLHGQRRRLQADFLVGADGKTGYVRKKYLEPKGILMERCEGTNYEETWVALNWKITLPTEKTHPEFPLWKLGYTPEQIYELFFPQEFRFLCNPARPSVCGRFGLHEDRLWRFEFVVHEDEDGNRMASDEETQKIIFPYITHAGSKYGLRQPVIFPADCITTLRSRPFSFSARSCNKWSVGRVIIAGDAAHVFPPFGGQGIASGFRDASALAWRLALLYRQPQSDHLEVLRAWYMERKQQLERSLAATIQNGEYVTERDPLKVFIREWYLYFVQMIPSWKREIEKGPRALGLPRYKHQTGFPFLPDMLGGRMFPQVYATVLDGSQVAFSDDLIFAPWKQGLFQLLLLPDGPEDLQQLLETTQHVTEVSGGYIRAEEATPIIQQLNVQGLTDCKQRDTARLASGQEFAAAPKLCKNRPKPQYYDPFRLQKDVQGRKFVVLRPDRYVYAACSNQAELFDALRRLPTVLQVS